MRRSPATVASLVGLEQKTISGFENRPENIKLETLFHILSAVNLEIRIASRDASSEQQWNEEW
jgi:HTH-type transcriptional regulator/antitoxin HipB